MLENIPNLSDVYEVLNTNDKYLKLDEDQQYNVVAMFQHWTDNFDYTNAVRCKACDFATLKNQTIRGQIEHNLYHLIDHVKRGQNRELWF